MRKLMMVALVLSGCSMYFGGDDAPEVTPDAGGVGVDGSLVYPCQLWDGGCLAAYDDAVAICDRGIRCDDYDGDRTACIADKMSQLCYSVDCFADYDLRAELDSCLADYNAAACTTETPACHL